MHKMFKIAGRKIACRIELWALAFAAFTMSACGTFWAGGVDEETNTVAAADTNNNHDMISSADSLIVRVDTSFFYDEPHEIMMPPKTGNQIVIEDKGSLSEESPSPFSPVYDTEPELHSFTGKLNNVDGASLNITVKVNGGNVTTKTDVSGYFQLEGLPVGVYPLIVSSGNSDGVAYLLKNSSDDVDLLGPVPSSAIGSVNEDDFEEPALQNFIYDDGPVAGNPDPQPEPLPESSDSNQPSSSSSKIIYLSSESNGVATNELPHDIDYGVIYHWESVAGNGSTEDNSNKESWYSEWTVEVSFELESIDTDNSYRRNIFGKFRGADGVFALTIINGDCGTEAPSYALFALRYQGFNCREAVISTAEVETGKKVSLTGVYKGQSLTLYKDGFKIAEKALDYKTPQDINTSPFVFGDEDLNLKLKDVRLGEKAITSADVLYRYYQQGGAQ